MDEPKPEATRADFLIMLTVPITIAFGTFSIMGFTGKALAVLVLLILLEFVGAWGVALLIAERRRTR